MTQPPQEPQGHPTPSSHGARHAEVNVLVVDDVEQNLLAMRALLQRTGLRVLTAASGAQALELLLANEVAVALLDVQMPEMDGFALAELMRGTERTRHIPIIFLTAASQNPQRAFRGYEAGAVDFLHKPIESNVLTGKVSVFVDLYRQRQQLQQQNLELQRVLMLNEMMTAVLTHDLRTPLSAIVMSAEIVQMRAQDEALQKAGGRIKSSSARMVRMLDQLLDVSRIRAGLATADVQPADLQQVCAGVVDEVASGFPDVTVDVRAQGDLKGVFDADRIARAFSSLIGSAVKYGESDRPVRVLLDGTQREVLRVEVANAGVLPEERLAQLVGPLGNTPLKESAGMGLSMYIVDQFVRAHGGQVQGRSNETDGTVFEFTIPRDASLRGH